MSPCPILLLSKVSTLQVSWGESTEGGADRQRMDGTKNCVGTAMCQKKWFLAKDWLLFVFFFSTYMPVCLCRSSDACSKTFSWLVTSPSWWKRGAKCADSTIRGCLRKNWHQMQISMLQGEHGYYSSTGMLICLTCYLWLEQWHVWRGIAGHVVELCQWKCCGTG